MARAKAAKKTAVKRTATAKAAAKKPAPRPAAKQAAAKRTAPRKVAARPGGEEVIYSDVRREMRSRLLGRLLGA